MKPSDTGSEEFPSFPALAAWSEDKLFLSVFSLIPKSNWTQEGDLSCREATASRWFPKGTIWTARVHGAQSVSN